MFVAHPLERTAQAARAGALRIITAIEEAAVSARILTLA